jgi:hypothetical protein
MKTLKYLDGIIVSVDCAALLPLELTGLDDDVVLAHRNHGIVVGFRFLL